MRVVAGVDCHKSSHTAVFIDAVGQVIDRITFPTTEAGYEQALALGRRLGCTDWGLEGAGCYGHAFSVFARAEGATVLEVPGVLTKRHRRHGSHRGKSDETGCPRDRRGRLARGRPPAWLPSERSAARAAAAL